MHSTGQSGAISRKLVICLSIPVILICLVFGGTAAVRHKHQRARADWKIVNLARLAELSNTNENLAQELASLKANRDAGELQKWTGEHVLLMANDEHLVYAFRHGFNNGSLAHLFLARGSDGNWYYSTFHFCNSMVAVFSDDAPVSIAEFAERYSARKFDGASDECLQRTWPVKQ